MGSLAKDYHCAKLGSGKRECNQGGCASDGGITMRASGFVPGRKKARHAIRFVPGRKKARHWGRAL
jgi:hypothetical protein